MEIIEGRGFRSEDAILDPSPVIISKTYADLYGQEGSVSFQEMQIPFPGAGSAIGVAADIQNVSFHDAAPALTYLIDDTYTGTVVVRLAPGEFGDGLSVLREAWKDLSPDKPFVYSFLDERIENQYGAEVRLAKIFGLLGGISILVAFLGLIGLAALIAEQRVKEIGIRRAMGATVTNIVFRLSKEFFLIVAVGVLVTVPLLFNLGNKWLNNFTDHVSIGPGLILGATAVVLGFVLLAVSYQSLKAALANPTDALRHE